jgi:anti-anti-sigma factor
MAGMTQNAAATPKNVEVLSGNIPECTIIRVHGPLLINNFFDFQTLTREQTQRLLLIDLTEVPYIDSAAIGSLVGVYVSREGSGKKYAIVGANERLRTSFHVTAVAKFLRTFPTIAEAEAALS